MNFNEFLLRNPEIENNIKAVIKNKVLLNKTENVAEREELNKKTEVNLEIIKKHINNMELDKEIEAEFKKNIDATVEYLSENYDKSTNFKQNYNKAIKQIKENSEINNNVEGAVKENPEKVSNTQNMQENQIRDLDNLEEKVAKQKLRLRSKNNPIVISTFNNEEDVNNYMKSTRDTEKNWFELKKDLINSKLRGKNIKSIKSAEKHKEKIGAKVKIKGSLIERKLKKIKAKNKEPEEMAEKMEKDNNKISEIEEKIVENISQEEDKKSKKEGKLAKRKKEKLAKKEFKERHASYASLIGKLYGLKPRKKLDEIMNDDIDRDLYNLTNKDAWIRAVATFNVGHRLSMIKSKEAKKYLISAHDQLKNEKLLANNANTFQYLEDTLLELQEIYIGENNFEEASRLNGEYMQIVEREKKEKFNPMFLEYKKNGSRIKEIDLMIEYRKKYVAGQKAAMKILYRAGHKFRAEELYRKILNESGVVLTDEAYDLSIKENGIENGEYIVIASGITYKKPILGDEKYLSLRNRLTKQLIKDKMNSEAVEKTKVEPAPIGTKIEQTSKPVSTATKTDQTSEPAFAESKVGTVPTETKVETEDEPVSIGEKVKEGTMEVEDDTKEKGIISRKREAIDTIDKEQTEESKEKNAREELIRKDEKEQRKREDEKKKAELSEFNKRYNDYNVLTRGILGESAKAKTDIQEIRKDLIHNDIYNMTSDDEATKGVATFRMGHRLATLPAKKKEAERLLKTAISILNNDEVLSKDDSLIEILQCAHMDLGNFYLMNDDFVNAEKSFVDYMETVEKEKVERYDPKILEAKKNGKVIDEIDLWMEIKSKFTAGKKAMIKLLSKSGKKEEAEELYKKLLKDCKISLSDEEYQLSVETNCIENGKYMRITKGITYREPILGNEYLLLLRKNISNKALSER